MVALLLSVAAWMRADERRVCRVEARPEARAAAAAAAEAYRAARAQATEASELPGGEAPR